MQSDPIHFAALAAELLARADSLVPDWLPGGKRRGHEWECGSLLGGAGDSCQVNLHTGAWADFATDERGGDLLALYKAIHAHASMAAAAVALAHEYGLEEVGNIKAPRPSAAAEKPVRKLPEPAEAAPQPKDRWLPIMPVPPDVPKFIYRHAYRGSEPETVDHLAEYSRDGVLYGYVVRVIRSEGGKLPLPHCWCKHAEDGSLAWKAKAFAEPRPLYFPAGLSPTGRTVILVEGEKKAQALQDVLDAAHPSIYCVASWQGGCNAWKKADWSWLAGSTVLMWPDCDSKRQKVPREQAKGLDALALEAVKAAQPLLPEREQPGMAAMVGIGAILRDAHGCKVSLLPIPAPGIAPDGWDCADAIAEGWDAPRMLALFAQAYTLLTVVPDDAKPTARDDLADAGHGGHGGGGDSGSGGDDGGPAGMPWWLNPYWDSDKGRWRAINRKAVIAALENDALLANAAAFNELSNSIESRKEWPWTNGKAGPLQDGIELRLGKYLSQKYGLPAVGADSLYEGIKTVALECAWHPVREYLEGLQHDGRTRLNEWLPFCLGYQKESTSADLWEYLCLVGRFWLIAMVARVMEPGVKFDYMPVLEGAGGLGKSTMLSTLAVDKRWFSDTHFEVSKTEKGCEQIAGLWIYEFGELAGFSLADVNLIKAFVSSTTDKYRPAYARSVTSFPRQVVLTGSTNSKKYLRDPTGNRRFWPIPCIQPINIAWLKERRDQLFAEALLAYRSGAVFHVDMALQKRLFDPMQNARVVESVVHTTLDRLTKREGSAQGESATSAAITQLTTFITLEMVIKALGSDVSKGTYGLQNDVRAWFDKNEWAYKKRKLDGARVMGYVQPEVWPPKEDEDTDVEAQQRSVGLSIGGSDEPLPGSDDDPF
jgi:putative DNA primase/helicase